jgi:hypothetical protein
MKYVLLSALLGSALEEKKPLFGGEAYVSLTASQLAKVESALAEKKETATAEQVAALEQEIATLKAEKEKVATEGKALSEALGEAMALNGLKSQGDAIADIATLGKTCKEYGDKRPVHTQPSNDGREQQSGDEVVRMEDAHNQL